MVPARSRRSGGVEQSGDEEIRCEERRREERRREDAARHQCSSMTGDLRNTSKRVSISSASLE